MHAPARPNPSHAVEPPRIPTFVPLRRRRHQPPLWPRLLAGGLAAVFCGMVVATAVLDRHQQKASARGLSGNVGTPTASLELLLAREADRTPRR